MNKKLLWYIVGSSATFGFFYGIFHKSLTGDDVAVVVVIWILLEVLFAKKFLTKELKGDELQRKVATMSDAVAGRVALILLIVYGIFEYSESLRPMISSFATWQILLIIFVGMTISASIAAVYYSKNPHKL